MKRVVFAAVCVLAVAGCGGDDGSSEYAGFVKELSKLPACADWAGKVVTAEQWSGGCMDANSVMAAVGYGCKDGTKLFWNDWGWGFGGKVATKHSPAPGEQEKVAPKAVYQACTTGS